MKPEQATALAFIERVNGHDVDGLVELLSEPHRFTDSLGRAMQGDREVMKLAWSGYFQMIPDYRIEIDRILQDGSMLILLGRAEGTCAEDGAIRPENRWSMPAAWRAEVRDGLISEWQVYADNSPIAGILDRLGDRAGAART